MYILLFFLGKKIIIINNNGKEENRKNVLKSYKVSCEKKSKKVYFFSHVFPFSPIFPTNYILLIF